MFSNTIQYIYNFKNIFISTCNVIDVANDLFLLTLLKA